MSADEAQRRLEESMRELEQEPTPASIASVRRNLSLQQPFYRCSVCAGSAGIVDVHWVVGDRLQEELLKSGMRQFELFNMLPWRAGDGAVVRELYQGMSPLLYSEPTTSDELGETAHRPVHDHDSAVPVQVLVDEWDRQVQLHDRVSRDWEASHGEPFWMGPPAFAGVSALLEGLQRLEKLGLAAYDSVERGWYWPLHCVVCLHERWSGNVRHQASDRREPLAARLRFQILQRDNFRCTYCGASAQSGAVLHVDHLIPVRDGGTNDPENLVTACANCNLGKSTESVLGG